VSVTRGAITARTRVAAVIGWPVEHSRSPAMHNAAFAARDVDAVMVALAVPPGGVAAALRGMAVAGFLGASVTVPHKEATADACDELSSVATRIGVVNCVVFRDGRAIGENTDAGGFVDAVREELPGLAGAGGEKLGGRHAVLLGAGGAARAVAAGLADAGTMITVVARSPGKAGWITAAPWSALPSLLEDCDLLVDCTSIGLDATYEETAWATAPLPLDRLRPDASVATLVYHREPRLIAEARARGHATMNGRSMLAHQGARAFTLWTGVEAPLEIMRATI
jgi:shikimate dehydrogenase